MKKNTLKDWAVRAVLLCFILISIVLLRGEILRIVSHYYKIFGLVVWILAPMAGLVLTSIFLLINGNDLKRGIGSSRDLQFVEAGGPTIGLLGTCLALQGGFSRLNLSTTSDLDAAIANIIQTIGISLSTTAFGLILGLMAWAIRTRLIPAFQREHLGKEKLYPPVLAKERPGKARNYVHIPRPTGDCDD